MSPPDPATAPTPSPAACILLRAMEHRDLREVERIEHEAYADAWPHTTFERELANGLAHYFVAAEPLEDAAAGQRSAGLRSRLGRLLAPTPPRDRVLGFAGVWYTVDQLHLVTIAVSPERQGQGIAARMLLECFALALVSELPSITLEVRVSNTRAQRLYGRCGFAQVGRLVRYYSDNDEDALVMVTPQLDPDATREHLAKLTAEHRARYGTAFDYPDGVSPATVPDAAADS